MYDSKFDHTLQKNIFKVKFQSLDVKHVSISCISNKNKHVLYSDNMVLKS